MTYGSNDWHRRIGRANKRAEMEMAAAKSRRQADKQHFEEFTEGESVQATTDKGRITGRIIEMNETDYTITIENWNHCVTVPARKVGYY